LEVCIVKATLLTAALFLLCPAPDLAQSKIEVNDLQSHPFAVDFHSGNQLRVRLRSGDFRIVGTDDNKITVQLSGKKASDARELTVRFRPSASGAELRISGGPRNDLQVTIRIPKNTGLYVRMPAGELNLEGISGNKDVELHAGDLTISGSDAKEYSSVDASVTAGDLEAPLFGESHGGLFRSFHKSGTGKYQLYAHVGAGDLTMN
jgi:hypothetical protein